MPLSNGTRPLEGRELSLLLNLGARVGMDVAWASMLDTGIAKRALDEVGAEWAYEDLVAPAGTDIGRAYPLFGGLVLLDVTRVDGRGLTRALQAVDRQGRVAWEHAYGELRARAARG